jgi:hypothetical protein
VNQPGEGPDMRRREQVTIVYAVVDGQLRIASIRVG